MILSEKEEKIVILQRRKNRTLEGQVSILLKQLDDILIGRNYQQCTKLSRSLTSVLKFYRLRNKDKEGTAMLTHWVQYVQTFIEKEKKVQKPDSR